MTIMTKLIPDIPTLFPHPSLLCSELLIVKEGVCKRLEITAQARGHHLEHGSAHTGHISYSRVMETEHGHKMLVSVHFPGSGLNHKSQIQPQHEQVKKFRNFSGIVSAFHPLFSKSTEHLLNFEHLHKFTKDNGNNHMQSVAAGATKAHHFSAFFFFLQIQLDGAVQLQNVLMIFC